MRARVRGVVSDVMKARHMAEGKRLITGTTAGTQRLHALAHAHSQATAVGIRMHGSEVDSEEPWHARMTNIFTPRQ